MDKLPKHLLEDYKRWEIKLNEFDVQSYKNKISTKEVLKAHYFIVDYFQSIGENLAYGIKDFYLIGSAVGRQFTSWKNKPKWNTPYEIGASLFYGLAKNHAFIDGNKRTALLILLHQLIKNNFIIEHGRQKDFEDLVVFTAANELEKYSYYRGYKNDSDKEVKTIAHFIKKNVRKADTRYYSMTYQEFSTKLAVYGFYFVQNQNYAKVCKKKKTIFGILKEETKIQVGFPGWKKQIGLKAAKEILKKCDLTIENGYDIQSFLHGNESMYRLIQDYEVPLRRLKDK